MEQQEQPRNKTKQEINKKYRDSHKELIKERRKRIEILCPDCNETRLVRTDVKRKSDRCNRCSILKIRIDKGDILHNLSNHPLYIRWAGMKQRIKDINKRNSYLDKGIIVCDDWSCNFLSFYNWSILNGFQEDLELDRINNDANYSPDNCRWVSHKINCNNK